MGELGEQEGTPQREPRAVAGDPQREPGAVAGVSLPASDWLLGEAPAPRGAVREKAPARCSPDSRGFISGGHEKIRGGKDGLGAGFRVRAGPTPRARAEERGSRTKVAGSI